MFFDSTKLSLTVLCTSAAVLASCSLGPMPHLKRERATVTGAPVLVTSSQDGYWHFGQAIPGEGEPTVTVDTAQTHQVWHGFGGTFNEAGWDALLQLSDADREQVMSLLFDDGNGVGFDWGRIPMGASDYALDRYTLNPVAGDLAMTSFTIERDRQLLIPFVKAAQGIKRDIKLWGSPWTPPPWMKTNNHFDGGSFDTRYADAYARYFVKWIQAYEAEGMPIDHVQPQNEPGWTQAYPSCAWGPSTADGDTTQRPVTLGAFVEDALAPAIAAAGLNTDIWYGTLSNNGTFHDYWDGLSPEGHQKIVGVGLQWGTHEHIGMLASKKGKSGKNLLVMQTEHRCGNYPWLGTLATSREDANRHNFLPDRAPNNHAYAEESWDMIKQWIEAGAHVYSAWNMVLDTGGFNMDTSRPWPQNALVAVDREAKTFELTPAFYVFRHLGQFIRPGATRVEVTGTDDALAFQNLDGSVVTVIFNPQAQPVSTRLSIDGAILNFEVPARGWATLHR